MQGMPQLQGLALGPRVPVHTQGLTSSERWFPSCDFMESASCGDPCTHPGSSFQEPSSSIRSILVSSAFKKVPSMVSCSPSGKICVAQLPPSLPVSHLILQSLHLACLSPLPCFLLTNLQTFTGVRGCPGFGSSLSLTVHITLDKPLGPSEPPIAHL